MTVLVVEDREIDRFLMNTLLRDRFEVLTASTADEAILLAKDNSFEVAILNVMLKEDMDAIDLLQDLQLICHPQAFVAYALTSHVDEARARRLIQAGFAAILYKPFSAELFQQLLKKEAYPFSVLLSV